jgi:hypothetical protein
MTKLFSIKKIKPDFKNFYKIFIISYSFYMVFFTQVFALQAEAPTGDKPFREVEVVYTHINKKTEEDTRIEKISSYYNRFNLPLAKNAKDFVYFADKYEIDWRLVAAIGMIESTGGKHACSKVSYSAFGWGSCKINFSSYKESIDVISKNLAGKNKKTAKYYAGKDIKGILEAYNPPSIVPDYADKVMHEMEIIASM